MAEEAAADSAPTEAPEAVAPVATDTGTPVTPTPETTPEATPTPAASEFTLPDEHKDKPWAAKVKSTDDLYKQIDNLTSLAGKKNAYPDAEATTEQLDEYYTGLRPESAEKYDFGEDVPNPEVTKKFGEMLFNSNISGHQSKQLIADYQAFEKATLDEATSQEGFNKIMTDKFGKEFDSVVTKVSASMKQHTSEESHKILNNMPNEYTGVVYEYINNVLKAHGVTEGGDNLHSGKGAPPVPSASFEEQTKALRQEAREIESRPHTAAEKQVVTDKLSALYSNKYK